MRKNILFLGLIFLFVVPLIAEEEIIFKSVLKDADFHPFTSKIGANNIGWWTLKFENGAVIRVWTGYHLKPFDDIYWIGKEYIITKEGKMVKNFKAKIVKDNKNEK